MKTYIIGKSSNLSKELKNSLLEAELISTMQDVFNFSNSDYINIIFNNFQKSSMLGDISSPEKYIEYSIYSTSRILQEILDKSLKVNKIIYTSSSSLYGDNGSAKESDLLQIGSLYSSLKYANEKLIETFCNTYKIDYSIARIFNIYGGNDSFSIISKIINSLKNKQSLTLINGGAGIRDFIHIDDVVLVYKKLLEIKNLPIVNVGTGCGRSVASIIDIIASYGYDIPTKTINKDEINVSVSDNSLLFNKFGKQDFLDIKSYLKDILDCL